MQHNKPVFTMLVGLPYSGKSVYAERLAKETGAVIHSSDAIREEILGDIQDQTQNANVFDELHRRVRHDLSECKSVIYDATNINYKRRMHVLQMFGKQDYEKVCVLMATPFEECIERSKYRDRVVPYEVLTRMYKSIWIPHKYEGWDDVQIVYPGAGCFNSIASMLDGTNGLFQVPQDNPHHTLTVGEHCRKTYDLIDSEDSKLLLAALLHDIGKPFTKSFVNSKGEVTDVAHYYDHHHVSAYDSLFYFDHTSDDFALDVAAIIQWHMRPFELNKMADPAKSKEKLKALIGSYLYDSVMKLHDADIKAH